MNTLISTRHLIVGLCMLAAAGLAVAMKPTDKLVERQAPIELESMIPAEFAGWRIDKSIVPVQISPDVKANLDKIYSQLLSRTYVNDSGERVMLSIAYGGDQSNDTMQVHRPEYCYAAQGFDVVKGLSEKIATDYGALPVKRLFASMGPRKEPITYWITIGEQATLPGFGRKLAQLKYGLTGKVPDGMLVRVSSIGADTERGYRLQDQFIQSLLKTLGEKERARVAGVFGA